MSRVTGSALAPGRSLRTLFLALAPLGAASAALGQTVDTEEAGRLIGRIVAAGVVLSSNDFAAGGSYDVDDDSESTFGVTHLGYRHWFRKGKTGPFPFIELSAGRVEVDQDLDLGGPVRDDSAFEALGVRALGGARIPIGEAWFAQGWGGVEYTWVESDLDYRSAQTRSLAPILDGVLFNWEAEVISVAALGGFGYHRESDDGFGFEAGAEGMVLRTDPIETDDPVQDVTTTSEYGRLYVVFDIPLGASIGGLPLRITPGIAHTFLDASLADPLDSDGFTEARVALAAILREPGRDSLVERIGLSVGYTRADAFEGWSFGLVLSPWSP